MKLTAPTLSLIIGKSPATYISRQESILLHRDMYVMSFTSSYHKCYKLSLGRSRYILCYTFTWVCSVFAWTRGDRGWSIECSRWKSAPIILHPNSSPQQNVSTDRIQSLFDHISGECNMCAGKMNLKINVIGVNNFTTWKAIWMSIWMSDALKTRQKT